MRKSLVKREVRKLLRRLGGKVTLDGLIRKSDCLICFFNNRNMIGDEILSDLGERGYARKADAFSLVNGDKKYIFLRNSLCEEEKLFSALHELGHLRLEHNFSPTNTFEEKINFENEANSFANEVLNHRYNRQSKTIALFAGIILVGMACFAYLGLNQTIEIKEDNRECFITATGKCYHINCDYLKDNGGVTWITIKEAKNRNFIPCKKCFPEEYKNSDV